MFHSIRKSIIILILISAFVLSACGVPALKPEYGDNYEEISTVDDLLAAIRPGAKLRLTSERYDLTTATGYGSAHTDYYSWVEVPDGYELVIHGVDGLTLTGNGIGATTLCTVPRYAAVLSFLNCSNISLDGLTTGHTDGAGSCSGAVVCFNNSDCLSVTGCDLYGCGTIALDATNSSDITVSFSLLRDCTQGGVKAFQCSSVLISECQLSGIGYGEYYGSFVFSASDCDGFAVVNCTVSNNTVATAMEISNSLNVYFGGNAFESNRALIAFFDLYGYGPVLESCSFKDNSTERWFSADTIVLPVSADGSVLQRGSDFLGMQCTSVSFPGFPAREDAAPVLETSDEITEAVEIHVSTPEEFLSAIGSNRIIIIDCPELIITDAYVPGSYHGNYYWDARYDGSGLVIHDVVNLTIRGAGTDQTRILATPRYVDVISFVDCRAVNVENLTAGHTYGSECAGGVLLFRNCMRTTVSGCDLFGCGIVGITAENCTGLSCNNTVIHDCSYGALWLYATEGAAFTDCTITDCGMPHISLDSVSSDCSYNGIELSPGSTGVIRSDGTLLLMSSSGTNYPYINYYGSVLYDITLHVGERILVTCSDDVNGMLALVSWATDSDCISISPNEDGSCFVEAVSPSNGQVLLTAFTEGNSAYCSVTIVGN